MSKLNYFPGPTPGPGDSVEVANGVFWLRLPLPFALNHINVWLLEDDNGRVLVDTGALFPETKKAWSALLNSDLFNKPLSRIIVTHHHPDHMGLAKWLSAMHNVPVHATAPALARARQLLADNTGEDEQGQLAYFQKNGVERTALLADFVNGKWYKKLVSGMPAEVVTVTPGEEMIIGGRVWHTIISNGHAEGHLSLYCESETILISGDQVLPAITSNISLFQEDPALDPLADYLGSMEDFRSLPPATLVFPSHGGVFYGLHERVDEILRSHRQRSIRINELCRDATTVNEMIERVFTRTLDDVNWCLAFGEVNAHLRHLLKQGSIQCQVTGSAILFQV